MNFSEYQNLKTVRPADSSYHIVVADIKGSTEAIRKGQAKAVNIAGGSCIAAIRNAFAPGEIPYVFGGDGASFLVPPQHLAKVIELLKEVQALALERLALDLRVGSIAVAEIQKRGGELLYGSIPWGVSEQIFFFRGQGLSMAEREIKNNPALQIKSEVRTNSTQDVIKGLSCELLPFRSLRGEILSLVIEFYLPLEEEDTILRDIFDSLAANGEINRLKPITPKNTKRRPVPPSFFTMARLHQNSFFSQLLISVFVWAVMTFKLKTKVIGDAVEYEKALLEQSDWLKMDGMLRLVLDLTVEEKAKILQKLEQLSQKGLLGYGSYSSKASVMTCHYQSPEGQRHTHFVDGEGGGLSMAAFELKQKNAKKKS